jgi:uncharacterized BrkB/YihY/UPF0761 family membrane protein
VATRFAFSTPKSGNVSDFVDQAEQQFTPAVNGGILSLLKIALVVTRLSGVTDLIRSFVTLYRRDESKHGFQSL